MTLQSDSKTLSEKDLDKVSKKIIEVVKDKKQALQSGPKCQKLAE